MKAEVVVCRSAVSAMPLHQSCAVVATGILHVHAHSGILVNDFASFQLPQLRVASAETPYRYQLCAGRLGLVFDVDTLAGITVLDAVVVTGLLKLPLVDHLRFVALELCHRGVVARAGPLNLDALVAQLRDDVHQTTGRRLGRY